MEPVEPHGLLTRATLGEEDAEEAEDEAPGEGAENQAYGRHVFPQTPGPDSFLEAEEMREGELR